MLKIKGLDPGRTSSGSAIHRALPELVLRLDADGGYSPEALDVARALKDRLRCWNNPPPLRIRMGCASSPPQPLPILADQSVRGRIQRWISRAGQPAG
jgi:hypothetical protein